MRRVCWCRNSPLLFTHRIRSKRGQHRLPDRYESPRCTRTRILGLPLIDEFGQARLADRFPYAEWDEKQQHDANQDSGGNQSGLMYCVEIIEIIVTRVLIERIEYFAVERYRNRKCASVAQGAGRQRGSPNNFFSQLT